MATLRITIHSLRLLLRRCTKCSQKCFTKSGAVGRPAQHIDEIYAVTAISASLTPSPHHPVTPSPRHPITPSPPHPLTPHPLTPHPLTPT